MQRNKDLHSLRCSMINQLNVASFMKVYLIYVHVCVCVYIYIILYIYIYRNIFSNIYNHIDIYIYIYIHICLPNIYNNNETHTQTL